MRTGIGKRNNFVFVRDGPAACIAAEISKVRVEDSAGGT
jgi:hypothetical protein